MDCECGHVENWDVPPNPQEIDDPGASDPNQPQDVPVQYHWGGCSDNIEAARTYTQAFLSFPSENNPQRRSSRYAMDMYSRYGRVPRQTIKQTKKINSRKRTRRVINLHNYRAGIKASYLDLLHTYPTNNNISRCFEYIPQNVEFSHLSMQLLAKRWSPLVISM